jgi:hypothetical protein
MKLVLSNNVEEIKSLVAEGYCPIECSIGGISIVDDLQMDHHGSLSHLESVAIRAYRDHYGARKNDPRFVCTGIADADATFAVASLAGIIPHPKREVAATLPPPVKQALTRDLSSLAETIARVDSSPIGLNIPTMEGGNLLLTWNAVSGSSRDTLGFYTAVGLWKNLLEGHPGQMNPFFKASEEAEKNRIEASMLDFNERSTFADDTGNVLIIKESRVFGFPEWYHRNEEFPADYVRGWKYPVVMAWLERGKNVTIGCPNDQVAEKLFGKGGLKNVFSLLPPEGWGGRESVGGSPRGVELSWEQVSEAAVIISEFISSNFTNK